MIIIKINTVVFLMFFYVILQAQESAPQNSAQVKDNITAEQVDTTVIGKDVLSPVNPAEIDTLASGKANPDIDKKADKDSIIVVKHKFNHKEQVIVGGVIMASLALILVSMNNYNPK